MKTRERENRDSTLVMILILLVGFICIILASGWAIRFIPSWRLPASMGSSLNPNSDFLTNRPLGLLEPLDPAILTNPVWQDVFLTPGANFSTRTPQPTLTNTPGVTPSRTPIPPTLTITTTSTVVIPPPVNTATRTSVPNTSAPTSTNAPPATLTLTPSNTPIPAVDLVITKTDNATHYAAGIAVRYIITVSNPSGSSTANARVEDNFSPNLTNISWVCAGISGASCTSSGIVTINDSAVILPPGSFVIYTVDATVVASPIGDLVNTATVTGTSNPDPDLSNNSATDTDLLIATDPLPGEIGTTPDDNVYNLAAGGVLTLNIATVVNGHPGPDLIYYEFLNPSSIPPVVFLDWVIIQVSDGRNWYTVFNWGDEVRDVNTNMDYATLPSPIFAPLPPPEEPDERDIPPANFYNISGVTIDLDLAGAPLGTYPWLRIISPPGDTDSNLEIDGIATCPSAACP